METKALPMTGVEINERVVKTIFAVAGNIDAGGDRIWKGAFKKTLEGRLDRIKVLWQHDPFEPPIGALMSLVEIGKGDLPKEMKEQYPDATGGLLGEVSYLETPRGDEVLIGIKSGAITEASIGYDPVKFDFEPNPEEKDGWLVRNLREIKLWDVSPVLWGMNPATQHVKKAVPFHAYPLADAEASWDGPAEVSAADVDKLKKMCAWYDPDGEDVKSGYKLPHHKADDMSTVWRGVSAAMGALMGSRGGVDIPEADREAVYNHLAKHYGEFEKEPPELKVVQLAWCVKDVCAASELKVGRALTASDAERIQSVLAEMQGLLFAAEPPKDDPSIALTALSFRLRMQIAERELNAQGGLR